MKKKVSKPSIAENSVSFKDLIMQDEKLLPHLKLSSEKMAQLLSLADPERAVDSPIPDTIVPTPAQRALIDELIVNKWAEGEGGEGTPVLNTSAQDALSALLAPKTRVQLTLGSIKELIMTDLYSSSGFFDGALVAYTFHEDGDLHVISPGQSPSDVSDALLSQLMNGPYLEGLNFELQLDEASLLVYLAVLDLIYARQLEAKLQADNYAVLNFSAEDVWQLFARLRIGEDLFWSSVLIPVLFPYLMQPFTEKNFRKNFAALVEEGLLSPMEKDHYQPTDFTEGLAGGLLPMISFASCVVTNTEGEGMHMGFVIGLNVNLVVQAFPVDGKNVFVLMGMDGVRLSRLLFEIGLPEEQVEKESARD